MVANPELEHLIELDKTDREIARLNAEINALPKRITLIEAQLAEARAKLDAAKARVVAIEAERRRLELDIQSANTKASKLRAQSSSVKTNEQYKAMLHEIAFAEAEIKALEDKILDGMEAAEKLSPQIRGAQAEYDAEARRVEEEKLGAKQTAESDKAAVTKLQTVRGSLRQSVDAAWLFTYERVSKSRGFGIAEARESRCTSCHVSLRPQTWNELINGERILTCDSCQRILFTREQVPEPAGAAKAVALPGDNG